MKGKKILILIVAAVVVIGAAAAAVKITLDQKKMTEDIINLLMKGEGTSSFQIENMINGEYKIGRKYLKIKDTEKFQEKICQHLEEFLAGRSEGANIDYVEEKISILRSEGLLNERALQLLEEFKVTCAQGYGEQIAAALQEKDYEAVARNLTWLFEQQIFDLSGVDMGALIDTLLENCKVYSVTNNMGAYYDGAELKSSSSTRSEGVSWMDPIGYTSRSYSEKSYGDFCVGTSRSTTHYEALEGFDFEHKYNTSSTSKRLYLRGKEVDGYFWSDSLADATKSGVNYLIVAENEVDGDDIDADGILFIGKDKVLVMAYYGDGAPIGIEGDFSQYLKKAADIYNEKYSQKVELGQANKYLENKQYEEAVNILRYYTHIDEALDSIYTVAVDSMRAGNTEFALETLEHIPYFDSMTGVDYEYLVENFEGRFDPDINNDEYTKPFTKFMMDVVGPMKSEDITAVLSGKMFKDIPQGRYTFNEDGTGTSRRSSSGYTNEFTWKVENDKLTIVNNSSKKSTTYGVYNILPNYYLLAYTTENSTAIFRTLLKYQ